MVLFIETYSEQRSEQCLEIHTSHINLKIWAELVRQKSKNQIIYKFHNDFQAPQNPFYAEIFTNKTILTSREVNGGYFLEKHFCRMFSGHVLYGNKRKSYNKDSFMVN